MIYDYSSQPAHCPHWLTLTSFPTGMLAWWAGGSCTSGVGFASAGVGFTRLSGKRQHWSKNSFSGYFTPSHGNGTSTHRCYRNKREFQVSCYIHCQAKHSVRNTGWWGRMHMQVKQFINIINPYNFFSCTELIDYIKTLLTRHSLAVWDGVMVKRKSFQLEDTDLLPNSAHITSGCLWRQEPLHTSAERRITLQLH